MQQVASFCHGGYLSDVSSSRLRRRPLRELKTGACLSVRLSVCPSVDLRVYRPAVCLYVRQCRCLSVRNFEHALVAYWPVYMPPDDWRLNTLQEINPRQPYYLLTTVIHIIYRRSLMCVHVYTSV